MPVVLSTPQKLELASALAAGFPGVPPAQVDDYYCFANPPAVANREAIDVAALAASLPWLCRAVDGNPSTSDEAALDYEIATGGACQLNDKTDGTSFLRCERPEMSNDGKILHDAFTESAFSKTLNLVWDFRCQRNPQDASEISCLVNPVKIASPAVWRADQKAGKVLHTLGKVAP